MNYASIGRNMEKYGRHILLSEKIIYNYLETIRKLFRPSRSLTYAGPGGPFQYKDIVIPV